MSGTLKIRFAPDMPAAIVDVVSPDMEVVRRLMLDPGRSASVDVPSEASFLRVHMPSGQVVTLRDEGNLNREVSLTSIRRRAPSAIQPTSQSPDARDFASPAGIQRYYNSMPTVESEAPLGFAAVRTAGPLPLGDYGSALLIHGNTMLEGTSVSRHEVQWRPELQPAQAPLTLRVAEKSGAHLEVCIPGNASFVRVRADLVQNPEAINYSVRVTSEQPIADAILNYLQRGDLYSAEAMEVWLHEAGSLLFDKMEDPYAAAIGAYLLLRLKRVEKMNNWARNLADWFPNIPDGCVIWAWQMIHQQPTNSAEIRKYLLMAAERGLPVYSEGLRLLVDGLRLMGDEGTSARGSLLNAKGAVIWSSPYTTCLVSGISLSSSTPLVLHDIAVASTA